MPLDLATANPYGAAIGAAAGVLQTALADTPTSLGSGAITYQAGPFTVGSKQVGGKGNSAGATTASASQTPTVERSSNAVAQIDSKQKLYAIIAGVVVVALMGLYLFTGRKKRTKD